MIRYKIDILYALKCRGFNSTFLRQNKILSESAMSSLRHDKPVSFTTLDRICALLGRDVSDIIEFVPDEKATQKKNEAYKRTAESMAREKGVSIAVIKRPKELHVLKGNEILFSTPADDGDMYRRAADFLFAFVPDPGAKDGEDRVDFEPEGL